MGQWPAVGWPRGLTPEVPFTYLTIASFYSAENQNQALLLPSGRVLPESSMQVGLAEGFGEGFLVTSGGC